MDTIRTVYVDSQYATESNGKYTYALLGGIAVPEGARVCVDNISFTNTFSEEGDADVHLVLSNAKRRKICVEVNERLAPPDALVLEGTDTPCACIPGSFARARRPPSPGACVTACSTRS